MAADILAKFDHVKAQGVAQWEARCPAHDDHRASLSIGRGADERWLLTCHAGCALDDILAKAGLEKRDLFNGNGHHTAPSIIATYAYRDEHGAHLFDVVRFEPKDFRQRAASGAWSLSGVRRVLYRLPELRAHETVYVCEGERDADALAALGLAATTNPGGAGKWRDDYTQQLRAMGAARVVVFPDNDDAGRAHAAAVAASCERAGLTAAIVTLPDLPPKGDVSDFLATHDRAALLACVQASAPADDDLSLDAAAFLATAPEAPTPLIADLIPGSGIVMLHGQPRSRKSLAILETFLAASLGVSPFSLARLAVAEPVPCWYLSEEDHAGEVKKRLTALLVGRGLSEPPTGLRLAVQKGLTLDDVPTQDRIIRECLKYHIRALALDPTRSLSACADQGPAELKPLTLALRRIMRECGAVIALLHHDTKLKADGTPDDRPRAHRASGGGILSIAEAPIHLERVSDGVSLLVPNLWKFSSDPPSIKLRFENTTDGALRVIGEDVAAAAVNTLALHEKIKAALTERPDLATSKVATAVHSRKEDVTVALEQMMAAGQVDSRKDGNAVRWFIRKMS